MYSYNMVSYIYIKIYIIQIRMSAKSLTYVVQNQFARTLLAAITVLVRLDTSMIRTGLV